MNVLIVAKTESEFRETVKSYDPILRQRNRFHHITTQEQMHGFRMPVQIRFVGQWQDLPEAPSVEKYAQHIVGAEQTEGIPRG